MVKSIVKRDGRVVDFNISKIENAIIKAMNAVGERELEEAAKVAKLVEKELDSKFSNIRPTVEQIQDCVESALMKSGHEEVARAYIIYRNKRNG